MLPVSSAVLRVVPLWAWAVAAALLYGGWQYRRAESAGAQLLAERAHVAALREQALHGALVETTRRLSAQQEVVRNATTSNTAAMHAEARSAAAAERMRQRAAAVVAGARARDPSTSNSGPPAASAGAVLADVLGRMDTAARRLAAEADRRGVAGIACERSYDALRAEP